MHLNQGAVLQGGKYRIVKVLGAGGFGITYLAIQPALNSRKVAIKEFFMKEHCNRDAETSQVNVPSAGSQELVCRFRSKFLKEAGTIAAMDNPHVVRIHDVFEENGTAYYVMEYLGDESLIRRIPSLGMSHKEAVDYIRQIGSALSYIHSQNILHLDVKPSNVLFRHGSEVVLIDFGISKHYDEDGGGQTSTSAGCVSDGYSPTEQYEADGVSSFTASTDIYSLGATFFHLLCGRRPVKASVVLNEGLEFPESMPKSYREFIEKAMQPRRKDRPQNVDEFIELLDKACLQASQEVKGGDTSDDDGDTVLLRDDGDTAGEETWIHTGSDDPGAKPDQPGSQPLPPEPPAKPAKKKSRRWLWWLLPLFLAAIGALQDKPDSLQDKPDSISEPTGYHEGHGWVDLGLPSGLKWATCNVGASTPGDYGNYYAWGETRTKSEYLIDNCSSYGKDWGDIGGDSSRDAARANWGGSWRMPTKAEYQELVDNCTWTRTTQNGHKGYRVTGKNGQSIFLPAAGFRNGDKLCYGGEGGDYWSSTPDESNTDDAHLLFLGEGGQRVECGYRGRGRIVRPVLED